MAAFVEHSFDNGFLLDEERIRKIQDIIATRLSKQSPPLKPKYKVYRGDSYSYVTESLEDVAMEDNDDWRKITRLDVLVEKGDALDFRLSFSHAGSELNIKGEDRDQVFLLFSDLREYMNNDVATSKLTKNRYKLMSSFLLLLPMVGFLVFMWLDIKPSNPLARQNALQSSNMVTKLDFIIQEEQRRDTGRGFLYIVAVTIVFMGLASTRLLQRGVGFMFPSNEFLFGRRKQRFEHRRTILNNILWIVLIGLAVSTIAGIIVWYVTKSKG